MNFLRAIATEQTLNRGGGRHPAAAVGSILIHLAFVGGLWSAQTIRQSEFRLAGGRGSVELQASVAPPTPTETPIVERLLPVQVRVEPDHTHVDRETIWTAPKIEPPMPPADHDHEADHPHPHPHEHRPVHKPHVHQQPPTAAALNVPIVPPSTAADASTATSAGNDETLPTLAHNPPPEYPAEAHQRRIQGTTLLRVGVRMDGGVEFVEIAQSSGHPSLDEAAVAAVQKWRFMPGHRGGRPAPFVLRLPIAFQL